MKVKVIVEIDVKSSESADNSITYDDANRIAFEMVSSAVLTKASGRPKSGPTAHVIGITTRLAHDVDHRLPYPFSEAPKSAQSKKCTPTTTPAPSSVSVEERMDD